MLCSSSHSLMSFFLVAVVGGVSFCLLWYVTLSGMITEFEGMFGSSCSVNHSMKCSLFTSS